MDGCSSHEDLQEEEDDKGEVTVMVCPPNCISVHQPMDQGIIAATKVLYRRELLDVKLSIMLVAAQLRAEAKGRKMARGTQGLANGSHPHMSDAADLLKLSWSKVTTQTIARCWVKAATLPKKMEEELMAKHGKVGQAGSKRPAKDPVEELADTINKVSSRVAEANEPGSPPDEEIVDLLANLDMNPGEAAGEAAIKAFNEWATFEDQEEVVEAFRQDAMDEMTGAFEWHLQCGCGCPARPFRHTPVL